MKLSAPEHTHFFSGYLDAVSRLYSNGEQFCWMSARVISSASSIADELKCSVEDEIEVEDMVLHFEDALAKLLQADTKSKILFYMLEYFAWYKEFYGSCSCKSYRIAGADVPTKHVAYTVTLGKEIDVLVYLFVEDRAHANA